MTDTATLAVDSSPVEFSPVGEGRRVGAFHPSDVSPLMGVSFLLSLLGVILITSAAMVGTVPPRVATAGLVAVVVIDALLMTAEVLSIRARRK